MKLAIFDCDGTLVDGQADVCAAMESAFSALGLAPPDRHAVRHLVGLSLPVAIARLAPEAEAETHAALVEAYKRDFFERRRTGQLAEPLFEGAVQTLDALRARGWTLAIATGKSRRGLQACLAAHGLRDRFASLQCADDHPSKPHPSMIDAALAETGARAQDAAMIGDTTFDIAMARAAGVRAIGVDWGYHRPEDLRAAGAEAIARKFSDLEDIL